MGRAMYRIIAQSDSETEWNRRCCPSLPLRVTRPDAAAADGHTDIAPSGRACAQLCFLGDRMESDSAPLCPNIVTRNPVSNAGRTAARRRCWRRRAGAIPPHGNAPRGWSQSVPTTRLTPPDARRRLAAVVRNRHPAPLRPKARFRSNHGSRTPGHDLPQAAVTPMTRNRNLLGYGAHAPASNTDLISNRRKFQQFQHFSSGRKFLQFQQCLRVCYRFQQSCHVTKLTAENRRRFAPKYAHICV